MIWLDKLVAAWKRITAKPAILDRRATAVHVHHGYPTRPRPLEKVTGICLHQAGVDLGERPGRYDTGGAHVFITRAGRIIWLHAWTTRVVAANDWSNGTVSVEFSGCFAGVAGRPETVWKGTAQTLTAAQVAAGLEVMRWICSEVPSVRVIVAHRQSSAMRRADPGSEIWQQVALPACAELGLVTANETTLGDGAPIPAAWDSTSRHPY